MVTLVLALVLAPLLIAAGTLAQRRFGQRIGGLIIGLPLTSLPLLFVVSVTHGPVFAGISAAAALEGTAAQAAFGWVWAQAVRRSQPLASTAVALVTFAGFVGILDLLPRWPAVLGAAGGLVACGLALRWWPEHREVAPGPTVRRGRLGLRMASAAVFALAVNESASGLGAHLAGLITALPLITLVMGALTHAEEGPDAAVAFLHGVMRGSFSVVTALLVLALLLPGGHLVVAFAGAIAVAGATQVATASRTPVALAQAAGLSRR